MPRYAPPGSYSMRFEGKKKLDPFSSVGEGGGEELICVDVWFSVNLSPHEKVLEELEDEHDEDHFPIDDLK